MKKERKKRLHIGRSAILGLRVGAFIVGIMAAVMLAIIGYQAYQARTGLPGGEITILPAFALFFYIGWTSREESLIRKKTRVIHERGPQRNAIRAHSEEEQ